MVTEKKSINSSFNLSMECASDKPTCGNHFKSFTTSVTLQESTNSGLTIPKSFSR